MRSTDDRLTQASNETRSQIAGMELQDRSTVERRVRAGRLVAGATAFVLVFGAFGVTAFLVGSGADQGFAPGAGGTAPPPAVVTESADAVVGIPRLGLDPDEWRARGAGDSGSQSLVEYESKTTPETVSIQVLTDERDRGVGYEYGIFLQGLQQATESMAMVDVVVYDGSVAKVFGFTDGDGVAVTLLWQHSDTVTVFSQIHAGSLEHAGEIAASIAPISGSEWDAILAGVGNPDSASSTPTWIASVPNIVESIPHTPRTTTTVSAPSPQG